MKMWLKIFSLVLIAVIAATAILLFAQEEKACCLCGSFRYHAPCLIDLETGDLIELDLYFPHRTLVAELAEEQPEMGTASFIQIGNISGIKLTDSKIIQIYIPNDKTYNPALCSDCKRKLPSGYTSRYIFADLYGKDEKARIPINADTAFSLRCYDIKTEKNTEKGGISVIIRGTLAAAASRHYSP